MLVQYGGGTAPKPLLVLTSSRSRSLFRRPLLLDLDLLFRLLFFRLPDLLLLRLRLVLDRSRERDLEREDSEELDTEKKWFEVDA